MPHGLTGPVAQVPQDEFAFLLVLLLAAFFFVNYFAGRMYNVSRGRKVAAIAKAALSDLDPSPQVRWTTKAVVLGGATKGKPVAEYRLTFLLMGRENLINWGIARLTGRADLGIFTANLSKKPAIQFDVIRKGTPPHKALRKAAEAVEYDDVADLAVRELVGGRSTIAELVDLVSRHTRIWTFSVRGETPQLVVNLTLQGVSEAEAREILQTVLRVCERINER
jgi:hypothetical protein